ncbi:four helix bundle protein [Elizabethkingia meningoseptica]|uniref:four helix bundle protein n=1 Tax=Elizabethkingia meningoseptica TaxID=238 RepID=UPI003891696E
MYQFYFEKLEVWQNAKNLSVTIYQLTSNFPEKERFGLVSQMNNRAYRQSIKFSRKEV